MIIKLESGRFQARLKSGRAFLTSRTFDTKREAQAWLTRERAALSGGIDPRAGRATVRALLPTWLEERQVTVSAKTFVADQAVLRLAPPALASLSIRAVTDREINRALITLTKRGLAESSVRRFRASLSSFFAWAVRERIVATNPVLATRVPKASTPRTEMYPFSEDELENLYRRTAERDPRLAEIVLIDAWTGLRWSELRAVRVRDFVEVPIPLLIVQRAEPEGVKVKGTKSGKTRRVPVADRILDLVRAMASGRGADERLFVTAAGYRLHQSAFKRTLKWSEVADGRRIHDLRHTAACLWLANGVDPGTVQAWMGHASIATTNLYLHHLGTSADRAGLDALNARFRARGYRGGTGDKKSGK